MNYYIFNIIEIQSKYIIKMGGFAVLGNRKFFSIILALVMIFSTMTVFANNGKEKVGLEDIDLSGLKWAEGPSFGEVKNKKFEVYGRLEIPKEFKGSIAENRHNSGFKGRRTSGGVKMGY